MRNAAGTWGGVGSPPVHREVGEGLWTKVEDDTCHLQMKDGKEELYALRAVSSLQNRKWE